MSRSSPAAAQREALQTQPPTTGPADVDRAGTNPGADRRGLSAVSVGTLSGEAAARKARVDAMDRARCARDQTFAASTELGSGHRGKNPLMIGR